MKWESGNLLGGGGTFIEGRPCMLNVFCALIMISKIMIRMVQLYDNNHVIHTWINYLWQEACLRSPPVEGGSWVLLYLYLFH